MRPRVLVVDDDPIQGPVLAEHLRRRGWESDWAADGWAVGPRLLAFQPDVLVLDLVMPGMCGLDVLQKLRADPRWASLPVLVLTAAADEDLKELPMGMPVLRKPVDLDEVVAALDQLVGGRAEKC